MRWLLSITRKFYRTSCYSHLHRKPNFMTNFLKISTSRVPKICYQKQKSSKTPLPFQEFKICLPSLRLQKLEQQQKYRSCTKYVALLDDCGFSLSTANAFRSEEFARSNSIIQGRNAPPTWHIMHDKLGDDIPEWQMFLYPGHGYIYLHKKHTFHRFRL